MWRFEHENLDVYRLAVEVARWVQQANYPRGFSWLRDEAVRASGSVVLNIAEGKARKGQAGANHFRIAAGSAGETCAALDLLPGTEVAEQQDKLRRIGLMLGRLRP
jgi:four helix bundle protein